MVHLLNPNKKYTGMLRKAAIIAALILTASTGVVAQSSDTALVFNDAGIDMNQNNITGLPTGVTTTDHAVSYGQALQDFVDTGGDTMNGNLVMDGNNISQVGNLDMNGNKIEDVGSADSSDDAMPRADILSDFVDSGGDSMTGNLDMNGNNLLNIGTVSGFSATGAIDMSSNQIQDVGSPTASDHAVPQSWALQNLVDTAGDTMTGDLDINNNVLRNADVESMTATTDVDMNSNRLEDLQSADSTDDAMPKADILSTFVDEAGDTITGDMDHSSNDINNVGTLNANTKNFVQQVNETHEAVYTSQESAQARAVVEGTVYVDGAETVSLPTHFSQVASDTQPGLNVQVTPHKLTTAAATQTTTRFIQIETGDAATVDYRVSAVRDGHEDKQVVRQR